MKSGRKQGKNMRYIAGVVFASKRKSFKWKKCLYHLLNLLLFGGLANSGNVLSLKTAVTATSSISKSIVTNKIDLDESAFTTSSSTSSLNIKSRVADSNLTKDINEKCSDKKSHRTEIITYHDSNFNESNKNSSSDCSLDSNFEKLINGFRSVRSEMKSRVNISGSNFSLNNQSEIFQRSPRRNARRKANKVKQETSSSTNVTNRVQSRGKVSLLGLFELTSRTGLLRAEGKSELAAAELAVKHINERRLLKGYTLELITNDTQVMMSVKLEFLSPKAVTCGFII